MVKRKSKPRKGKISIGLIILIIAGVLLIPALVGGQQVVAPPPAQTGGGVGFDPFSFLAGLGVGAQGAVQGASTSTPEGMVGPDVVASASLDGGGIRPLETLLRTPTRLLAPLEVTALTEGARAQGGGAFTRAATGTVGFSVPPAPTGGFSGRGGRRSVVFREPAPAPRVPSFREIFVGGPGGFLRRNFSPVGGSNWP